MMIQLDPFPTEQELAGVVQTQRNPIEIARELKRLIEKYKLNQRTLAQQVGRRRSTITNYLRLLTLPPLIQESLSVGQISMGHAKLLLSLNVRNQQMTLHQRMMKEKLTVRQAAAVARSEFVPPEKSDEALHTKVIAEQLQELFGTRIEIEREGKGGWLNMAFYDLDDLQRLLEKLGWVET